MKSVIAIVLLFINIVYSFSQTDLRGTNTTKISETPKGNTYALIIGISKYKNIKPLLYADNDAKAFYDYLVSDRGMNIDSSNVILRVNEQANIINIGNDVSDILKKDIKKGDRILFFFAGHGDYDAKIMTDQALLLLQAAPKDNYFQNVFSGDYISTNDLQIKFISELLKREAEVILIIDACHSGGMNGELAGGEQGGIITANALNTIQSTVKLYSCQAKQSSIESKQYGGGRGLFSYVLMEGLYGMADVNNDGMVSMKELQRYLEDNIPILALPNKQDPLVKVEDNTMVICKVNQEFLAEYKKTKDKNLPFLAEANTKGNEDTWLKAMSDTQKELYTNCKLQIENKELDKAYTTYKQYELLDKTSEASVFLQRNLSAALQEKTALILTPMFEDVSKFEFNGEKVSQAIDDLEKAKELLGKEHFLYKNLQARSYFLKSLLLLWSDDITIKTNECIQYLEQSIALEPNAPYSYYYLSYIYSSDTTKYQEAEKNIKKYLDLIPTSFWGHYSYCYLLHKSKRYHEAEKEYKTIIELDSNYSFIHCDYGLLLYDLKRYDEAEVEYKKSIGLDSNIRNAHYNYGILLYDLKRYPEAENEFKNAIALDPDYASAHDYYGSVLYELHRYEEAENEYKKAIELDPKSKYALCNYGYLLYYLKRFDEAEKKYRKTIEVDSNYIDSHYEYGFLLYAFKRYDEAEKEFKKTIQLDSNYVNAHGEYADLLFDLKRYDEAEKEYKKTIELDSNNINAHYFYGNLLYELYRHEEAEKQYKKTIQLDPDNINAYYYYSYLLKYLNRYPEAIENYKTYCKLSSDYAYGYKQIADIYFTYTKQYDSSAYYYKKLITINKQDTSSIDRYAYSLWRLNKMSESIKCYKNEIKQFPGYVSPYYNMTCIYSLQNEKKKAVAYFKKSLKNGMDHLDYLQQDTDIDNIRSLPEFKAILLRYFTQEKLDEYPNLFIIKEK